MKDMNLFWMFHTAPELAALAESTIVSLSNAERERLAEIKEEKYARILAKFSKTKKK